MACLPWAAAKDSRKGWVEDRRRMGQGSGPAKPKPCPLVDHRGNQMRGSLPSGATTSPHWPTFPWARQAIHLIPSRAIFQPQPFALAASPPISAPSRILGPSFDLVALRKGTTGRVLAACAANRARSRQSRVGEAISWPERFAERTCGLACRKPGSAPTSFALGAVGEGWHCGHRLALTQPALPPCSPASRQRCRWLPLADACEIQSEIAHRREHSSLPEPSICANAQPRVNFGREQHGRGPRCSRADARFGSSVSHASRSFGPNRPSTITRFIRGLGTTCRAGHRPFSR